VFPYLDDLMFMKHGFWRCAQLARRVEREFIRAGLKINVPKCNTIPAQQRRQLGFDVDFADGVFRVPQDRCDALKLAVDSILSAMHGRAQALMLASVTGTVLSTHMSWGPLTQLYSRHLYALINSVMSLIQLLGCVDGGSKKRAPFYFGKVCLASDLRDPFGRQRAGSRFAWRQMPATSDGGGHTLQSAPEYAHEYFSQEESVESSTFLLGV